MGGKSSSTCFGSPGKSEWILYGEGEVAKDDIKVMPFLKPPVTIPVISAVQAGVWTDTFTPAQGLLM